MNEYIVSLNVHIQARDAERAHEMADELVDTIEDDMDVAIASWDVDSLGPVQPDPRDF